MKTIIIHENSTRKIINVEDETTKKHAYFWLDEKGLIEDIAEYQRKETKLILSKGELQQISPIL